MDLICLAFASFVKNCCGSVTDHKVKRSRYVPLISPKTVPHHAQSCLNKPFFKLYASMRLIQMTEEAALNSGLLNHNSVLRVLDLYCQFDELCFWNTALFPRPQPIKLIHHCNFKSWCRHCPCQGRLKRKWLNDELNFAHSQVKTAQRLQ